MMFVDRVIGFFWVSVVALVLFSETLFAANKVVVVPLGGKGGPPAR